MGTISLFSGRAAPVIGRLSTEEQALDVAQNLSTIFAARADGHRNRAVLPKTEIRLIAKAGLLGISVPSEYGGIDVSNAVLCDVLAWISEADGAIAPYLRDHFYILDSVRATGSEAFKSRVFTRALSGALFGCLPDADDATDRLQQFALQATGSVFTLDIAGEIAGQDSACDWIGVLGRTPDGRPSLVLLDGHRFPAIDADDFFPYSGLETTRTVREFRVPEGSVSPIASPIELKTSLALQQLLGASIALGAMTAAFSQALDIIRVETTSDIGTDVTPAADPRSIATIGSMAARLDGAKAMIERASKMLDIAQVTPNPDHIEQAGRAALAAHIVVADAASDIQQLLAEVAGAASVMGQAEGGSVPHPLQTAAFDPDRQRFELGTRHLGAFGAAAPSRG